MTLQSRYDTIIQIATRIQELLDKQDLCIRSGGRLPIQDRKELYKLRCDLRKLLELENKLKGLVKQSVLL